MKYTIHFGENSFKVNEWLYNYFNSVKNKPKEYKQLYRIITGVSNKANPSTSGETH